MDFAEGSQGGFYSAHPPGAHGMGAGIERSGLDGARSSGRTPQVIMRPGARQGFMGNQLNPGPPPPPAAGRGEGGEPLTKKPKVNPHTMANPMPTSARAQIMLVQLRG